jgi:hypothetical protein
MRLFDSLAGFRQQVQALPLNLLESSRTICYCIKKQLYGPPAMAGMK